MTASASVIVWFWASVVGALIGRPRWYRRQELVVLADRRQRALELGQQAHLHRHGPGMLEAPGRHEVTDGRLVGAAQHQRRVDRPEQLRLPMDPPELEQPDHLLRPGLAPVALDQRLPEAVVALRPAAEPTPLLQRLAAGERAGLALQHVEVVLEIEDLLVPAVAPLVTGHALALVPDLHAGG
ncbi:MAG TPA: hypothetical protein VKM72_03090 [Thermoanaerobaculia bacterium]|nr:hypothetical protein [Thermoanaerobaculia bacterium]